MGRGLLPFEILELVDRELASQKFASECTPAYLATIRKFVADNVTLLADHRRYRGMFDALERETEWDEDTDLSMGASGKLDLSIPLVLVTF
jgi:DNA-directed RNA polymerase III subunit RPC1